MFKAIAHKLHLSGWESLGLAALFSFYLSLILFSVVQGQTLVAMGVDYRVIWSAGYIANHWNYAEVYCLERLEEVQSSMPIPADSPFQPVTAIPSPYPPIFILPFQPLALLPPVVSFWVWQAMNFFGLGFYLLQYTERLNVRDTWKKASLILLGFLSMPVFINFWEGQVNLWLMICVGEFFLRIRARKPFWAGLWLSGLLMKPQLLVLVILALLLQRAWKALSGFFLGAIVLLTVSICMLGTEGIHNYLVMMRTIGDFSNPGHGISPQAMVNWRMLGVHLSTIVPETLAWNVTLGGMILTGLLALSLWLRPIPAGTAAFGIALLGTFAATCILTWHSHQHTMMILIPLFLFLWNEKYIPGLLTRLWLFLLPAATLTMYILAISSWLTGIRQPAALLAIPSVSGFALGMIFLLWSFSRLLRHHHHNIITVGR